MLKINMISGYTDVYNYLGSSRSCLATTLVEGGFSILVASSVWIGRFAQDL